jgi:hypothetical protein
MQCNVLLARIRQDVRESSIFSLIDYFLLLTKRLCASGIRANFLQKGCRSRIRDGATVGSKDNGLSSHLAGVAKGLQLYRVDLRVADSCQGHGSKEERAEKERRKGHLLKTRVVEVEIM